MATLTIPDEGKVTSDPQEIVELLKPFGIWYERWEAASKIADDATNEEVLETFAPEIERLKERGGFVAVDVINVTPAIPNLDEIMAPYSVEHTHSEDEVRFTVSGAGTFYINPPNGPVCAVLVEEGDLINVPEGTRHWFKLTSDNTIKCIRLFIDPAGWTADPVDSPVHEKYASA